MVKNDTSEEIIRDDSERNEVIEKDSILWRASEWTCKCENAVKSPIIPVELKSIGLEEESLVIWKELSAENEYCDVTFVCEGKQILDHKVVLTIPINM